MHRNTQKSLAALLILVAASLAPATLGELRVSHAYNLSDFSGTIPYNYASLHVDREFDEIYVTYQSVTRIFNASGMETYSFGDQDPGIVTLDLTVVDGDIFTLVRRYRRDEDQAEFAIEHRDYRGDLLATHEIVGLSADAPDLNADNIFHHAGELLIVDKSHMRVLATDLEGRVTRVRDLAEMLAISERDADAAQIFGFDIDPAGNMLFTVPVLFRAYRISPDGDIRAFGKGGSVAGSFGVAAGIVGDDAGRVYVADRLRSVVIVFDANLRFVTEFGYRGRKPENLIRPSDLAIGNNGTIYVTQLLNRGVAVFRVTDSDSKDPGSVQAHERKEARHPLTVNSSFFKTDTADQAATSSRSAVAISTQADRFPTSSSVRIGTLAPRATPELHEEQS